VRDEVVQAASLARDPRAAWLFQLTIRGLPSLVGLTQACAVVL